MYEIYNFFDNKSSKNLNNKITGGKYEKINISWNDTSRNKLFCR